MYQSEMMIFCGNGNKPLAADICAHLKHTPGNIGVARFSDGEILVEIRDNVRNKDVFLVQSLCAPVNDNLMELLILSDAFRRASAGSITAVIPYLGYARQDRRPAFSRVPISARVVADMITAVGINRVLAVDLHAEQIQGFFDIPLDNVYAAPVLVGDLWRWRNREPDLTVISPDVGGVARARALAKQLEDAELAIIDKRRPRANEARVMNLIGEVQDRPCVIVDDIVDTAGTLCQAATALKHHGASKVSAYCTHPVLSGDAVGNIQKSDLDELVVTDTIPLRKEAAACGKIRQLKIAALLAESIRRMHEGESLSSIFMV